MSKERHDFDFSYCKECMKGRLSDLKIDLKEMTCFFELRACEHYQFCYFFERNDSPNDKEAYDKLRLFQFAQGQNATDEELGQKFSDFIDVLSKFCDIENLEDRTFLKRKCPYYVEMLMNSYYQK